MFLLRVGMFLSAISLLVAQDASVLRITSASPIPPAIVGVKYLYTLSVAGGTSPYLWAQPFGTLPPGLSFSPGGSISGVPSGAGSASVTVSVTDAVGARVTQTVAVTVIEASTMTRLGVVSHIAAGGAWSTSITLVNSAAQAVPLKVILYGDDGRPWSLPVILSQQGFAQSLDAASIDGVLNPATALVITTGALPDTTVGWAEVLSPGPLTGFAIFRTSATGQGPPAEGTVPLQIQTPAAMVLAYDNTAGFGMGAAFANASTDPIVIAATIWDDYGTQIASQSITLAGKGHTAFALSNLIPASAGKRGVVRFQTASFSGLAGLGLRFSPFGTFTSVPGF